jgi:DNA-binding beta-propeller fold protein YncE
MARLAAVRSGAVVVGLAAAAVLAWVGVPAFADETGDPPAFVQTIGGSGAADMYPSGLEVAADGTIVIADTGNNSVAAYSPSGTQLWRVGSSGSGTGQFNNPRDIGIDSAGDIYVADTANTRIVKLTSSGQWVTSWKGPAGDRIKSPIGISVHGDLVYVADGGAAKARVFTTTGSQVRVLGTQGACTFSAVRDVDADADGNVYVANYTQHNILKLTSTGTCIAKWGSKGSGQGQFAAPYGVRIAADPVTGTDLVYVADSNNNRVQVFTLAGAFVGAMGSEGTHDQPGTFTQLRRVAVAPDGDVWGADLWGWRLERFDRTASGWTSAQRIGDKVPQLTDAAAFHEPRQIAFDAAGHLRVADTVHHRIVEFTQDGQAVGSCGFRGSAAGGFNWPRGVAVDVATGDLWVADTKQYRLQVLPSDCAGARILGGKGTGAGQFNWPMSLAIRSSDRTVWVADTNNSRITVWNAATKTLIGTYGSPGSGTGQFNQPRGIAVGPDGHIWVADRSNNRIVELAAGAGGTGITWVRSIAASFSRPEGVAVDSSGNVYVADTLNDRLVILNPDGTVRGTTTGPDGLQDPAAVSVGPDGRIYVADTGGDRVQVFTYGPAEDTVVPDSVISQPATGSQVSLPATISGTATDNVTVAGVEVAVRDRTTSQWWDFATSTWVSGLRWGNATLAMPGGLSTDWSMPFNPSGGSGAYFAQARATDGAGNVEADKPSVRFEVSSSAGVPNYVSTLVPPGLADLTPVDVAATDTRYYALDVARYRIAAVDRSTGTVVDSVGGSRGSDTGDLAAARSLALDSAGNLYVADTPNARVTVYDADLNFVRQWGSRGTGAGQFTQVYGVAIGQGKDAGGQLTEVVYAVDGAGRIQKFTLAGALIGAFAGGTTLNQPRMAEVHPVTNDLWVVNARDREVVVFDVDGIERFRFGTEGSGDGQFKGDPRGIAISPDGTRAYVSDEGNHRVQVFDGSGAFVSSLSGPAGSDSELVDARGLDTAEDGTLVVSDEWDYALKEWTPAGAFQRQLFGSPAPVGGVNSPRGLAVDAGGRVFVSDWWNQRIQRFGADGSGDFAWGFRGTRAEPGSINFAWDLALQPGTNRVFLANRESHEIEVFTSDGDFVTRWGTRGADPGRVTFPHGVAFEPATGDLLVTDSGNSRINRYSIDAAGNGTFVTSYGTLGTGAGQFDTPTGIDVAADGTIWVADTRNSRIQKRDPATGVWTAYTGVGGPSFNVPWGVSVDPDGDIWIADTGNDRIIKADPAMSPVFVADGAAMGAGPLDAPFEIEFGPSDEIYVSDTFNNRVITLEEAS